MLESTPMSNNTIPHASKIEVADFLGCELRLQLLFVAELHLEATFLAPESRHYQHQ